MKQIPRWDDIRIFNACIEHGSLSGAAAALSIQQSTVSRRIAALEDALGGPLFTRTSEGVIPTNLARALAQDAAAMEEHSRALERLATGHERSPSGTVRLALIEPVALYLMLPNMDELSQRFPDLRVELLTSYTSSDLTRQEADIALRFMRPTTGDLIATKLADFSLGVLASHDYIARFGTPTLESGRWVNTSLPWLRTPEERWYEEHMKIAPWLQTSSYVVATEAILSGMCAGMTTSVVRALHPERVITVELGVPTPAPLELWLVTHESMRHVPRIDAIWTWLSDYFARERSTLQDL